MALAAQIILLGVQGGKGLAGIPRLTFGSILTYTLVRTCSYSSHQFRSVMD